MALYVVTNIQLIQHVKSIISKKPWETDASRGASDIVKMFCETLIIIRSLAVS